MRAGVAGSFNFRRFLPFTIKLPSIGATLYKCRIEKIDCAVSYKLILKQLKVRV